MRAVLRSGQIRQPLAARTTIGKQGCDIVLTSPVVDRQHAIIEIRERPLGGGPATAFLTDLNSSKGTHVNGMRLQNSSVRLAHGDIISFGLAVGGEFYHFELEQDQSSDVSDGSASPHLPDLASSRPQSHRVSFTPTRTVSSSSALPRTPSHTAAASSNTKRHTSAGRPWATAPTTPLSMASSEASLLSAGNLPNMNYREKEEKLLRMGDEINRLAAFEGECQRKELVIADLRQQFSGQVKEADDSGKMLEELTARLRVLEARQESDKLEIATYKEQAAQVPDLRKELSQRRQSISSMADERKKVKQDVASLEASVNQLRREVADKGASATMLRSELSLSRTHRTSGQKEVEELRQSLTVQQTLSHERAQSVTKLTKALDESRKELARFDQMRAENDSLRVQVANALSQLESKEMEASALKSKVTAFTGHITELLAGASRTFQSTNYVSDLNTAAAQVKEVLEDNGRLTEELETLQSSHQEVIGANEEIDDTLTKLTECCTLPKAMSVAGMQDCLQQLCTATVPEKCALLKDNMTGMLQALCNAESQLADAAQSLGVSSDATDGEAAGVDVAMAARNLKENATSLESQLRHARKEHEQSMSSLAAVLRREADADRSTARREWQTQCEDAKQAAASKAVAQQKEGERGLLEKIKKLEESLELGKAEGQQSKKAVKLLQEELEVAKETKTALAEQIETEPDRLAAAEDSMRRECRVETDSLQELCRQHSLTIVALEEKLLASMEETQRVRSHKTQETACTAKPGLEMSNQTAVVDDMSRPSAMAATPSGSGLLPSFMNPPRSASTPLHGVQAVQYPHHATAPVHTDHLAMDRQQLLLEIQGLQRLLSVARKDTAKLQGELHEQSSIAFGLRRDLAGASAQVQDLRAKRSGESVAKERKLRKELEAMNATVQRQTGEVSALKDVAERYRADVEAQLAETQYLHQLLDASHGVESEQREELKLARQKWKSGVRSHREQLETMQDKHQKTFTLAEIGARCQAQGHDRTIRQQADALRAMRSGAPNPLLPTQQQQQLQQQQAPTQSFQATQTHTSTSALLPEHGSWLPATSAAPNHLASSLVARTEREIARNQLEAEREAQQDLLQALEAGEKSYCSLVRSLSHSLGIAPLQGTRSVIGLTRNQRTPLIEDRSKIEETLSGRTAGLRAKMERKEQLLLSYEEDLRRLRSKELEATALSAKVGSLEVETGSKTQELTMLRESVRRLQDELDQQMRLNVSMRTRQVYKDSRNRQAPPVPHSCLLQPAEVEQRLSTQKEAFQQQLQRKDLEVQTLKNELAMTDGQLQMAMSQLGRSGP